MLRKISCLTIDPSMVDEVNEKNLIVDIRNPNTFNKGHIKNATNLITSGLLIRRLQRGTLTVASLLPRNIVKNLRTYIATIIIYDDTSSYECESKLITVISSALKKEFPKLITVFINGGFDSFSKKYPSRCELDFPVQHLNPFHLSISSSSIIDDPVIEDKNVYTPANDICPVSIMPYLYLGNADHASDRNILDKIGISGILNVSKTCPVLFQQHYRYKTIPVDDTNNENISVYFEEAVQFIDEIKSQNGKILVHCRAGISRSATICIAYLMRTYDHTLDQAYEYIKKKRAAISPNFNFLGQLVKLENELALKKRENNENQCPLTVTLPIRNDDNGMLTSEPFTSKVSQFFTYSPNSCVNFFNVRRNSESISPLQPLCPILLTPS